MTNRWGWQGSGLDKYDIIYEQTLTTVQYQYVLTVSSLLILCLCINYIMLKIYLWIQQNHSQSFIILLSCYSSWVVVVAVTFTPCQFNICRKFTPLLIHLNQCYFKPLSNLNSFILILEANHQVFQIEQCVYMIGILGKG